MSTIKGKKVAIGVAQDQTKRLNETHVILPVINGFNNRTVGYNVLSLTEYLAQCADYRAPFKVIHTVYV